MSDSKANGTSRFRQPDWLLCQLLRLIGVTLMLAAFAVLLPSSWMQAAHDFLQIEGEFTGSAITLYLARSTSMLYALHGAIVFAISFDVQRYRALILCLGWLHFAMGITVFLIDLFAPMPLYWTLIEGGPISAGGIVVLLLGWKIPSKSSR